MSNIQKTQMGTIGKIIIPEKIENYINILHSKIGNTEWFAVLFYKLTKGNIKSMKNLEFTVDFLYPMNIGTAAYTEFNYNGALMEAYDIEEDLINSSTGICHTH